MPEGNHPVAAHINLLPMLQAYQTVGDVLHVQSFEFEGAANHK